jgi:integrase
MREPAYAHQCQRVLAIPSKRHEKRPIDFLLADEIDALLGIIDRSTWIGRRDRTLLSLAVQTGLRVSELVTLRCRDIVLTPTAFVRCEGKGRKQRSTPLRRDLARSANVAETPASPKFNVEGDRGMHDDKSDGETDRGLGEGETSPVLDSREDSNSARGRRLRSRDRRGDRAAAT